MAAGDYSGRPGSGRGAQRRRAGLWEAMDRTRIRWRNAARIAAGVAAAGGLALVVPDLLEPPAPPPLPADIGLATAPGAPLDAVGSREPHDSRRRSPTKEARDREPPPTPRSEERGQSRRRAPEHEEPQSPQGPPPPSPVTASATAPSSPTSSPTATAPATPPAPAPPASPPPQADPPDPPSAPADPPPAAPEPQPSEFSFER